ncbi:unnamed protein product [Sphenostylis stenocarpa]|uniref:Uncharacterized protein n=1 Tax=Sphenostylis stenocarpa TaxID=92480 RepID=A0AA86VZU7_9FABA|nr:unnamed protein product [Sphenostylis stenocarpa]
MKKLLVFLTTNALESISDVVLSAQPVAGLVCVVNGFGGRRSLRRSYMCSCSRIRIPSNLRRCFLLFTAKNEILRKKALWGISNSAQEGRWKVFFVDSHRLLTVAAHPFFLSDLSLAAHANAHGYGTITAATVILPHSKRVLPSAHLLSKTSSMRGCLKVFSQQEDARTIVPKIGESREPEKRNLVRKKVKQEYLKSFMMSAKDSKAHARSTDQIEHHHDLEPTLVCEKELRVKKKLLQKPQLVFFKQKKASQFLLLSGLKEPQRLATKRRNSQLSARIKSWWKVQMKKLLVFLTTDALESISAVVLSAQPVAGLERKELGWGYPKRKQVKAAKPVSYSFRCQTKEIGMASSSSASKGSNSVEERNYPTIWYAHVAREVPVAGEELPDIPVVNASPLGNPLNDK